MAVTKSTPAAPAEAKTGATAPQSIALQLSAKIKRYSRMCDKKLYEGGVVYHFSPEKAAEVQKDTDERGYPVFMPAKPAEEQKVMVVNVGTPRQETVDVPLAPDAINSSAVHKIDISDDDPEIAAHLAAADSDDDTGVSV